MSTLESPLSASQPAHAAVTMAARSAPVARMRRVAHLTTAHARRDIRIHLKECETLAAAGYEVHCVMADGKGPQRLGAVEVHDIGAAGGRFKRMLLRPWRMLAAARALNADLYHLHDPELLLVALFLQRGGARVIYDSHEDVPRSLLARDWVPAVLRGALAAVFERFENFVARRLSAVVGATPHIARRFAALNPRAVAVNNFPLDTEIEAPVLPEGTERAVCYIGGIGRIRGIVEIVQALETVDAKLLLAGPFETAETEQMVRALPGWAKVEYAGVVGRDEVRRLMARSRAGLVLFHPAPNHVDAQPNKMFEYMSAGLPVLGSNFPMWRDLLEGSQSGRCVDPLDPAAISKAITDLLDDSNGAGVMGRNGREAVLQRYRWSAEAQILKNLYMELLR